MLGFGRVKLVLAPNSFPPNSFPTDRSKAVALLFFLCAPVVSYVLFVVSLFVPHLSLFWCLGRSVLRDCGISSVSSRIFSDFLLDSFRIMFVFVVLMCFFFFLLLLFLFIFFYFYFFFFFFLFFFILFFFLLLLFFCRMYLRIYYTTQNK